MKEKNITALLVALIALTVILTWLTGCTTQRKAEKYYQKHPEKLAEKCADEFPVKDSIIVIDSVHFDTLYLEGEPVILKDSFFIKGDTIIKQITKECPKVQTITKTVTHDSIIYRRDIAYETTLDYTIQELKQEVGKFIAKYEATKEGRDKWRKWCLITWAICAVYLGLIFFKSKLPFRF